MNSVDLYLNSLNFPTHNHNTTSINCSMTTITYVFKKTINEMIKSPWTTIFSVTLIPAGIATGVYLLLIFPTAWIAYNIFQGIQLSEKQRRQSEAFIYVINIYNSLTDSTLIRSIIDCRNLDQLKSSFATIVGTFDGSIRAISCFSIYENHFAEVEQLQVKFKAYFESFVFNENSEENLENYKQNILTKMKEIQTCLAEVIKNKVPM